VWDECATSGRDISMTEWKVVTPNYKNEMALASAMGSYKGYYHTFPIATDRDEATGQFFWHGNTLPTTPRTPAPPPAPELQLMCHPPWLDFRTGHVYTAVDGQFTFTPHNVTRYPGYPAALVCNDMGMYLTEIFDKEESGEVTRSIQLRNAGLHAYGLRFVFFNRPTGCSVSARTLVARRRFPVVVPRSRDRHRRRRRPPSPPPSSSHLTRQPRSLTVFHRSPSVEVVRQFRRGDGVPELSTSGNRSSLTRPTSGQRPRVPSHNNCTDSNVGNLYYWNNVNCLTAGYRAAVCEIPRFVSREGKQTACRRDIVDLRVDVPGRFDKLPRLRILDPLRKQRPHHVEPLP
jgi:hypothetical protein